MERMTELLCVLVKLEKIQRIEGALSDIVMIPFSGEACGPYFQGNILPHAVDTQKRKKGEKLQLSARYMLTGTDDQGNPCRMFIENNGTEEAGGVLRTRPVVVTDSPSLAWMEQASLTGTVEGTEGGVIIRIYGEGMEDMR